MRCVVALTADAGVGVPRSPGRNARPAYERGVTLGGVASAGADASWDAGTGTRVAATAVRPTIVAPGTAVIAPGTSMFE